MLGNISETIKSCFQTLDFNYISLPTENLFE